jgi:hypothetical protein
MWGRRRALLYILTHRSYKKLCWEHHTLGALEGSAIISEDLEGDNLGSPYYSDTSLFLWTREPSTPYLGHRPEQEY